MIFFQLLINGLIAGAIYALVAAGFSLIYRTSKFVNFAHGTVVAVGAYILYALFSLANIGFGISVILTIILSAFFGWLMNLLVFRTLRKRGSNNIILLLSTVGILILIESLIQLIFGASVKTIGFLKIAKGLEFLGAIITPLQIVIIITATILLIALFLFIKKTKMGKAIRAVSDNKDVAEIVGISSEKIYSYAFIIGSAIAGIAGILIGMEQNLKPTMGTNLMIKGFTGAVIGGMSSVSGAVVGSFILGLIENFGIWFLPSGYKDAIAFVILFIFLIIKPEGIFGKSIKNK
ncbi:MAG: branched-chain amino acid ABC transporter permease [Candidatus Paceibacterota bacterium]